MSKILITGGAGYIGAHMAYVALRDGYEVVIMDNFINSDDRNIKGLKQLVDRPFTFIEGDLRTDLHKVDPVGISAVIHFAALKAVGESMQKVSEYYENNLVSTLNVTDWAIKNDIRRFIFSSSASVYGTPQQVPVEESAPLAPESVYARTKMMSELILQDLAHAGKLDVVNLRYFNPAGNVPGAEIGDPQPVAISLVPAIVRSALGLSDKKVKVFGTDYPTKDGSGVRDYIHVLDLVEAHLKALEYVNTHTGFNTFNLGLGKGYSVLEVIKMVEKVLGGKVEYEEAPRREGDVVEVFADASKANKELGWKAERELEEMVASTLKWYQKQN